MKIVIAPDSFKESLAAADVARAIADGLREVWRDAECVLVPMADGGEGTVAAVVSAAGGAMRCATVTGPLGERVEAQFGLVENGCTAIVEMAAASGLELVPSDRRDPMRATSFGTGELLLAAIRGGARHCVIGIGGSATVDGGIGMLQGLGARVLDKDGKEIGRGGGELSRVASLDLSELKRRVKDCTFEVACDVTNPLTGPNGAAAVFGPQKGASEEDVKQLARGLEQFARVVARDAGVEIAEMAGAGAAGGVGGALVACAGAKLLPGVELVAELVGLEDKLRDADLVITGEGRMDGQTVHGKTPVGVARLAKKHAKPVIVLAGSLGKGFEAVYGCGIDAVFPILPGAMAKDEAYAGAAANLRNTASAVARLLQVAGWKG